MQLFPAYAGVIPLSGRSAPGFHAFPRIRGGDPQPVRLLDGVSDFSPHTRG